MGRRVPSPPPVPSGIAIANTLEDWNIQSFPGGAAAYNKKDDFFRLRYADMHTPTIELSKHELSLLLELMGEKEADLPCSYCGMGRATKVGPCPSCGGSW
jgi:hypothetical protein